MVNRNPLKRPGRRPADCADGRCHAQLGGGNGSLRPTGEQSCVFRGQGRKAAGAPRSRISSAANPCIASGKACVRARGIGNSGFRELAT